MDEKKPRLNQDGHVAQDAPINIRAVERKAHEAEARAKAERDAEGGWTREKVMQNLAMVDLEETLAVVDGRDVKSTLNLAGADLSGLDLSKLDLSKVNLFGANLSSAKLSHCRLVGANLAEAVLEGAQLDNVNAVEAGFHGACLCGATFEGAHLMMANLSECCAENCTGLDVSEKPVTNAELKTAEHRRAEGFRVDVVMDEQGKGNAFVRYVGRRLEKANIYGMTKSCKRKQ